MPMKTQVDMSEEDFVLVKLQKRGEFICFIDLQLVKRAPPKHAADDRSSNDMLIEFASAYDILSEPPSNLFSGHLELTTLGKDFWQVSRSNANDGWGPFLYDIAMELAAEKNVWLCSDDSIVSPEAHSVWEYYFQNRPDVDQQEISTRLTWDFEYLKFGYRKNAGSILKGLRETGRITECVNQCDESEEDNIAEVDLSWAE